LVTPGAERSTVTAGSQPELRRTLGSFQVFAISFAFISVAVGIFGTYDEMLRSGGRSASGCGRSLPSARGSWRW
jgi:hypothetical protein